MLQFGERDHFLGTTGVEDDVKYQEKTENTEMWYSYMGAVMKGMLLMDVVACLLYDCLPQKGMLQN